MSKHNSTPEKNRPTTGRLLAKLLRELLESQPVQSLPDLTDTLKKRCASLRIRYTDDDITEAYRLLTSNRALPGDGLPPRPIVERGTFERPEDELSPAAASKLVGELLTRVVRERGLR